MKILNKIIQIVILGALIAGLTFYFKDDIKFKTDILRQRYLPCSRPIVYSLGQLDPQFGINQEDLLKVIDEAVEVWEEPIDKDLFSYSTDGSLKINLVYDSRQETTNKLDSYGDSINSGIASYETLKFKYEADIRNYNLKKAELDKEISVYKKREAAYESNVQAVNSRGGAEPQEFAILEQEREDLTKSVDTINKKQESLNKISDDINALVMVINKQIRESNLDIKEYNTFGEQVSGEFQEGEYVSDESGQRINIYQFDDFNALVWVLAHEFGHALGFEHVDNPEAIMYRLNMSGSAKLT
ncbi:MAG: matrixin family metalloprotease, partial [Patescibacteria group bacterium]